MSLDSFDMWTDSFCFCCDKQTTGEAYCSEACRLADFEKPATTTTTRAPSLSSSSASYTSYMPSTYEYSGHSSPAVSSASPIVTWQRNSLGGSSLRSLTPSSSHSSLCSIDTMVAMGSSAKMGISDAARRELQSYAKQFEHVRSIRRRSY